MRLTGRPMSGGYNPYYQSYTVDYERLYHKLRREAVEKGFAEFAVKDPLTGTTEFRWLDKPSPPSPETAVPPQPE